MYKPSIQNYCKSASVITLLISHGDRYIFMDQVYNMQIHYLPSTYKMQFNKFLMHTREIRCAIQQSFLYIQDATLQNFKYIRDAILYLSRKCKMQSNNLSMLTKYIRCGIQFFSMDR